MLPVLKINRLPRVCAVSANNTGAGEFQNNMLTYTIAAVIILLALACRAIGCTN